MKIGFNIFIAIKININSETLLAFFFYAQNSPEFKIEY
jgi:hypothetical protein